MKKLFLQKNLSQQKGFTLLFAVLVSTLVVSIGASIISIALRQTILSGTSRESQYAFYAANTVLECAFYWDLTNSGVFPVPGDNFDVADTSTITCAGGNIITGVGFDDHPETPREWEQTSSSGENETTFFIEIKDQTTAATRCAQATVTKTDDGSGAITTRIEAKGYNTCDFTNPRTVERGLVQEYQS